MEKIKMIDPKKLVLPLEFNSRNELGDLEELKLSIQEEGLLQPPLADKNGRVYVGFRRVQACVELGLDSIPVVLASEELSEKQMLLSNITENLQRVNLNPVEEARAIRRLQEEHSMSIEEVAQALGKSKKVIRDRIQILKLNSFVQEAIELGEISVASAMEIDRLPMEKQASFITKAKELAGVKLIKLIDKELAKIEKAAQPQIEQVVEEDIEVEEEVFEKAVNDLREILLESGYSKKSVKKIKFSDLLEEEKNAIVTVVNLALDSEPNSSETSIIPVNPNVETEISDLIDENLEAINLESSCVKEALINAILERARKIALDKASRDQTEPRVTLLAAQEAIPEFFKA